MKNIINFKIDFWKIPVEVKKYLYIHNDLYRWRKINPETNKEKLVEIFDSEIKCEPFWFDEIVLTWDKEIDDLLNLESLEMKKYIEQNSWKFGIFVRESLKEKLLNIDKNLKEKWYFLALKIWYRPLQVQKNLFEKIYAYYKEKYKNLWENEIYDLTSEMISDPDNDVSPHITGWAIDVVLYDKNWNLVDMWCPVNFIWEEANLTTEKISETQKQNREILQNEFLKEGFSCLASEWWHFSYGDPYWSEFYGKDEALYNMV